MQIHTVKAGDTVFKIARQYSTSPMKIIENNGLENPDRLAVGKELVILIPTRTYTVRGRDTLADIAKRFGVRYDSLLANNPYLSGSDKIYPGQLLSVKYDTARYGMASANGYYYNGTSDDRLMLALPYINYLTVSAGRHTQNGIQLTFNAEAVLQEAKKRGKIPLLRVYDDTSDISEKYARELTETAKRAGYSGIMLASYKAMRENKREFEKFLITLKKYLMEEDMLLHCELDANCDTELADICDGYTLMYEKCNLESIPSFDDSERRMLENYAEKNEPSKAFIEIPSFAYMKDEELTKSEAEALALQSGKEILFDPEKKICFFDYNRYIAGKRDSVRVAYDSAENIKSKLELLSELGLMGISFDIMRVPTEYLMMFETMFTHPFYPEM